VSAGSDGRACKARIEIITLYILQRAGRLLCASNAAKARGIYKGDKLSIDVAERLGYAVKGSSASCHACRPGIDERASIIGSADRSPVPPMGVPMPIEVRFSAINEPVGGDYALGELSIAPELGSS
jgi:hypothetical protein